MPSTDKNLEDVDVVRWLSPLEVDGLQRAELKKALKAVMNNVPNVDQKFDRILQELTDLKTERAQFRNELQSLKERGACVASFNMDVFKFRSDIYGGFAWK